MNASVRFIDAAEVTRALAPAAAVEALRDALQAGYRPETDHARIADPLAEGEFLLMPSETTTAAGVKVLTVAPGNAGRNLPRIQGLYLLFDAETLAPTHVIDGPSLTGIRTAAVSIAAVQDALLRSREPLDVVVFGTGPQGRSHVETLRDVLRGERVIAAVTAIARAPERVATGEHFDAVVPSGSADADAAVARAGLIVCATTARSPLFDGVLVRDDAVVVAVGSHEPDARELDGSLLARADVVVEDLGVALRECGDVIMAVDEGALDRERLITMADAVTRAVDVTAGRRPLVFKSAGMPWQDLVIAEAIARE